MLKKKHLQSRQFTLIEILMAMSIFLILSLIMMRFFTSSQRIFSLTSQRNMLYADARIAMDLIARDLQGAMYNNDNSSKGIYPFWFQKIDYLSTYTPDSFYTLPPNNSYNSTSYSFYDPPISWTALNFIASTNLKPEGANSNVCELRYTAVPAGKIFTNADGSSILEGWLIRSCTADNADAAKYNFASNPRSNNDSSRLSNIWGSPSFVNFEQVIPNVYELKFTCYCYYPINKYDSTITYTTGDWVVSGTKLYISEKDANKNNSTSSSTYWLEVSEYSSSTTYKMDDLASWSGKVYRYINPASNSNKQPDITSGFWQIEMCKFAPSPNSDAIGSNFPVVVKIDLSLLSDTDWFQWKNALKEGNGNTLPAERILRHKLRTFSKAVYIPPRTTY